MTNKRKDFALTDSQCEPTLKDIQETTKLKMMEQKEAALRSSAAPQSSTRTKNTTTTTPVSLGFTRGRCDHSLVLERLAGKVAKLVTWKVSHIAEIVGEASHPGPWGTKCWNGPMCPWHRQNKCLFIHDGPAVRTNIEIEQEMHLAQKKGEMR